MGKLICPHCGGFTSFSPVMLVGDGIIVAESSDRVTVRKRVMLAAVTDKKYMPVGDVLYAILECQGCNEWFVAERERYGDEWIAVYPIPHKYVSEDIPEPIKSEFEETHLCYAVGAYRGCLSMCGTALEAVWRERGASGLEDLRDKGTISPQLFEQARKVRLWGNVAKHEPMPDVVEKEDSEQLLTYLEALLDAIYVQPKRLSALTQKREQLKKDTKPKPPLKKDMKPDSGLTM